jgi:hypothetical protein
LLLAATIGGSAARTALVALGRSRAEWPTAVRYAPTLPVIRAATAPCVVVTAAAGTLKTAAPTLGIVSLEISVAVRRPGLFEPVRRQTKVKGGVWVRHGRKISI